MVGKDTGVVVWTRPILRKLAHRRHRNTSLSFADAEDEVQRNEEGRVGGTPPISDRSDFTMRYVCKKCGRFFRNEGFQKADQEHCQEYIGSLMNILRAAPLA